MTTHTKETSPGSIPAVSEESSLEVTLIYDDVRSPAEILRISSGGLFAKTGLLLQLGDQVALEFSFGTNVLVTCQAQVTRIEPQTGTDEEIGLGIRYLNMDARSWLKIEKHVYQAPTIPPVRTPSARMNPASTSQRFRIINQNTDRRISHLLSEIENLQRELLSRYDELRDLLDGSEKKH